VPPPILELHHLSKRFGDFAAVDDLSLDIAAGEFLTLLGASGSGKTTTLRMIAGFEPPTAGEILMAGAPIAALPPFKRDINTVFQHYALFPHMSVRDNIAYGLRMRGVPAAQREEQVTRALEMVKLEQLGARSPRQLSGGQQQRVALARALVNRPRVLLLDEPLGALDLKLRKEMQLELKHLQTDLGITFVYVTHDQEEALTMSDRIVLMRQGRIAQIGTPRELYDRPASRYVADFIGDTNLLAGSVVESAGGVATLRVGDVSLRGLSDGPLPAGREAWLTVRPEAIRLIDGHAVPAAQNTVAGTVDDAVYAGSALRVHVTLPGGQRLIASVPSGTSAPTGAPVTLSWPVELARCVGD
jgi:spermidine/putrescine transport system ATP-binding protein